MEGKNRDVKLDQIDPRLMGWVGVGVSKCQAVAKDSSWLPRGISDIGGIGANETSSLRVNWTIHINCLQYICNISFGLIHNFFNCFLSRLEQWGGD